MVLKILSNPKYSGFINLGSEAIPVLSVMCCCGEVLDYEQVNLMTPLTGIKELSGF